MVDTPKSVYLSSHPRSPLALTDLVQRGPTPRALLSQDRSCCCIMSTHQSEPSVHPRGPMQKAQAKPDFVRDNLSGICTCARACMRKIRQRHVMCGPAGRRSCCARHVQARGPETPVARALHTTYRHLLPAGRCWAANRPYCRSHAERSWCAMLMPAANGKRPTPDRRQAADGCCTVRVSVEGRGNVRGCTRRDCGHTSLAPPLRCTAALPSGRWQVTKGFL